MVRSKSEKSIVKRCGFGFALCRRTHRITKRRTGVFKSFGQKFKNGWKYSYGVDAQYVKYDADIFNTIKEEVKDNNGNVISPAVSFSSNTAIEFFKFGAYGQVAKRFFDDKFLVSGGIRADINTYTKNGLNPLRTLSPRVSLSYAFNNQWNISASVGSYYKLPVYTMLGYKDNNGTLANKDLKYTNSIHYTIGTEFVPKNDFMNKKANNKRAKFYCYLESSPL